MGVANLRDEFFDVWASRLSDAALDVRRKLIQQGQSSFVARNLRP